MWRSCRIALALALCAGCNLDQDGEDPTPRTLNFPIALGLSNPPAPDEPSRHLFVVNSNFDLRFNQASILAFDLNLVHQMVNDPARGCTADEPCTIESPDDIDDIVADEVAIGSHAEDLAVSPSGTRLYLPVRADRNLTFIDWNDAQGLFACGEDRETDEPIPDCGDGFRAGAEGGVASERELVIDGDPVGVAVGRFEDVGGEANSGDFVMLAMREGRVALFLDQAVSAGSVPELVHIAEGFPESLIRIELQPGSGIAWLTSAADNELGRVAISTDPNPLRSFLYDFGRLTIDSLDDGRDTRDIRFDPSVPDRAFVLARRPEAVVEVDLAQSATRSTAAIDAVYEVGAGPSRLALVDVEGRTIVLASCFDARRLFVIDADHGALISTIGGFTGPYDLAVDPARNFLYMADFTTSVIRVIDLAPLADGNPPAHVATIGKTTPPETFAD
jgi:hypothetical protein